MNKLIRTGTLMLFLATSVGCGYLKHSPVLVSPASSQTETVSPIGQTEIINQENVNFNLTNIVENTWANGFEQPTGLSVPSEIVSSRTSARNYEQRLDDKVFVTKPAFNVNIDAIQINPKIFRFSGNNFSLPTAYELTIADIDDFNTSQVKGANIGGIDVYRPLGLLLNTILANDGSVILSSNKSKKLFEIDANGSQRVYLDSDELIGITSMIAGSDGKVYCTQAPLVRLNDGQSEIVRSKRVISIDSSKNIKVEFELPNKGISSQTYLSISNNAIYSGAYQPFGELIKIVENTELGKQFNDSSKFYISDWLNSSVYKVSEDNQVSLLDGDVRYPSSIAVGNLGNVFVVTGPLLYDDNKTVASYPELLMINPKTGNKQSLYTLDKEETYSTHICKLTNINNTAHCIPISFELSTILFEDNKNIELLFTNSQTGTLKSLEALKSN